MSLESRSDQEADCEGPLVFPREDDAAVIPQQDKAEKPNTNETKILETTPLSEASTLPIWRLATIVLWYAIPTLKVIDIGRKLLD